MRRAYPYGHKYSPRSGKTVVGGYDRKETVIMCDTQATKNVATNCELPLLYWVKRVGAL